jgi:hypothetical protein
VLNTIRTTQHLYSFRLSVKKDARCGTGATQNLWQSRKAQAQWT